MRDNGPTSLRDVERCLQSGTGVGSVRRRELVEVVIVGEEIFPTRSIDQGKIILIPLFLFTTGDDSQWRRAGDGSQYSSVQQDFGYQIAKL